MAKSQLLILGQALDSVISATLRSVLVIVDAMSKSETGQAEAEALEGKVDGMTFVEKGRVGREVGPAINVSVNCRGEE